MNFFRRLRFGILALLAVVCGKAQNPVPQSPDEHKALTIYQIMVASFIHDPAGAPGYTAMWGPDGHTKNGNLLGVVSALDHIKNLGANAIWLTPVFDSSKAQGGEKLQATGYFTNNFFAIDPHFGTEEDFRLLVDEAHKRGLYVILDGVFGHHGGVEQPSPSGYTLDCTITESDRGKQGGTGNISYPGSLDYIKEVATFWMDKYGIDGWRLDQAYQATQGGHNYWTEIRGAVEKLAAERKQRGEQWGTLAYMVGEDWGNAETINKGVFSDAGLLSAFDFEGKELISGPMQDPAESGLDNGWEDVVKILSSPTARGYAHDNFIPNLFLTNHDGYRLADHFDPADSLYYNQIKTRNAILAAYSGPITLYYGDEYADSTRGVKGAQKDNIARTSGHLEPNNPEEADLCRYISRIMNMRRNNPALWRGDASFDRFEKDGADVLVVTKTDMSTGNKVAVIFSTSNVVLDIAPGASDVHVEAYVPEFIKLQ